MPVISYCLSGTNSFCLLCEDGSGPFKYFPLSAVQCQTWSVGISEGTLKGKGFCPLTWQTSAVHAHCPVPTAQAASSTRLLPCTQLPQSQAPAKWPAAQMSVTTFGQFCSITYFSLNYLLVNSFCWSLRERQVADSSFPANSPR